MEDSMTLYKREMLIFKSHLRTNLIRSAIFPVILIFFFGSIGSSTFGVNIAVVNYANNAKASSFINSLTTNRMVSISAITTQTEALDMLSAGKVSVVVVILPSFPSPSSGNPAVDIYYSTANFQAVGGIVPLIQSEAEAAGSTIKLSTVNSNVASARPLYGTISNYKTFLVGGIISMTVAFGTVFGAGMSLITDRELGNLKSFLISPINKTAIILSKIFSGATQSVLYIAVTLTVGAIDGVSIAMGFVGLLWIFALGLLVALGFAAVTTVLASRIAKIEVYTIIAQVIVMPMWFLSGAFFPTTSLPSFLQPLVAINPMTYATDGIRNVMMLGYYPFNQMILDVGVLSLFVAFGFAASVLLFKSYTD